MLLHPSFATRTGAFLSFLWYDITFFLATILISIRNKFYDTSMLNKTCSIDLCCIFPKLTNLMQHKSYSMEPSWLVLDVCYACFSRVVKGWVYKKLQDYCTLKGLDLQEVGRVIGWPKIYFACCGLWGKVVTWWGPANNAKPMVLVLVQRGSKIPDKSHIERQNSEQDRTTKWTRQNWEEEIEKWYVVWDCLHPTLPSKGQLNFHAHTQISREWRL